MPEPSASARSDAPLVGAAAALAALVLASVSLLLIARRLGRELTTR